MISVRKDTYRGQHCACKVHVGQGLSFRILDSNVAIIL